MDLENSKVNKLAQGLYGSVLRIGMRHFPHDAALFHRSLVPLKNWSSCWVGGSPQDAIFYDIDNNNCSSYKKDLWKCNAIDFQNNPPQPYICLTMNRYKQINAFAKRNGLKLVFGLNGCYQRPSGSTPIDMSNILGLLNYTVMASDASSWRAIWGFEFGNELWGIKPDVWAKDVMKLKTEMDALWKKAGLSPDSVPKLIGLRVFLSPHK